MPGIDGRIEDEHHRHLLEIVCGRLRNSKLWRAWATLVNLAKDGRRKKNLLRAVGMRVLKFAMGKAWTGWRDKVSEAGPPGSHRRARLRIRVAPVCLAGEGHEGAPRTAAAR